MNAEQAKEINSSQNWGLVREELDLWIRAEESKLRHCIPEQLFRLQETINALERVRILPQVVIDRES